MKTIKNSIICKRHHKKSLYAIGLFLSSVALLSCSGKSETQTSASRSINSLSSSNIEDKFSNTYEFESFLPTNNLKNEQICNKSGEFCAVVTSPPPATHDIGQKKQRWVSQYSNGRIIIDFKKDVNEFKLEKLQQSTVDSSESSVVGIISEIYTPSNNGEPGDSCFNRSHKKGDRCIIGVTYKGINFTAKSSGQAIQNIATFDLKADNGNTLDVNMTLYNAHKSNGQNIGILSLEEPDDPIPFVDMSSMYNNGIVLLDNLLKTTFINMGDGVLSFNKDTNHIVEVSLGVSNPSANLHNLYFYNNRYDNSFNCKVNNSGEAGPSSPCDMFGFIQNENATKNSYFSHVVFKYIAQPTGEGKTPIVVNTMIPILFSQGDFVSENYEVERGLSIPELNVFERNVVGDNLAYTPIIKNATFSLKSDFGVFIPYKIESSQVTYNITDDYNELPLDYTIESNLVSLAIAPDYYKVRLGKLLDISNQPVTGGLLVAHYKGGQGESVNQIIGTLNAVIRDVRPQPPGN